MLTEIVTWFENNPIPSPPEIISWASICIAIFLGFIKLWETWQTREKLDLRVLVSNRYSHFWHASELGEPDKPNTPWHGQMIMVKAGDCKSSFEVLEFSIRNNYRRDITIGRFHIAEWIYSDKYAPQMYGKKRDYRVFDLFTREPINLENYRIIPPGGMFGIRLEIWEEANSNSPRYISNHVYYKVDLLKHYSVEFNTDIGRIKRKIKLSPPEKNPVHYPFIYHWSEDLIGPMEKSMSLDLPQAVVSPYETEMYPPWYKRLLARSLFTIRRLTRRNRR